MVIFGEEEPCFSSNYRNNDEESIGEKTLQVKNTLPKTPSVSAITVTIHIPLSHFKERINHITESRKIAYKTRTYIDSYEVSQYSKIRFNITGKWRDTLEAGRLLWYSLTKNYTIYINSAWANDLDRSLPDQSGISFSKLYKRVSFMQMEEFNLIAVTGPCWDVFKIRKELLRRRAPDEELDVIDNNRMEVAALQILKSVRAEIHEDMIQFHESMYQIKNSQLLELLIGPKVKETLVLQNMSTQVFLPKSLIQHEVNSQTNSKLEAELTKLEIIEVPDSPCKHHSRSLNEILSSKSDCEPKYSSSKIFPSAIEDHLIPIVNSTANSSDICKEDSDTLSNMSTLQEITVNHKLMELKTLTKRILQLLDNTPAKEMDEETKSLLFDVENKISKIKAANVIPSLCYIPTPFKELLETDFMNDLCNKSTPKRYSKMRANSTRYDCLSNTVISSASTPKRSSNSSPFQSHRSLPTQPSFANIEQKPIFKTYSLNDTSNVVIQQSYCDVAKLSPILRKSKYSSPHKNSKSPLFIKQTVSNSTPVSPLVPNLAANVRRQFDLRNSGEEHGKEKIVQRLRQLISQTVNTKNESNEPNTQTLRGHQKNEFICRTAKNFPRRSKEVKGLTSNCFKSDQNGRIENIPFQASTSSSLNTTSLTQLPVNLTSLINSLKRQKNDTYIQNRQTNL